jgi:predicted dehydrogenase
MNNDNHKIFKVFRFFKIYGIGKTLFKVAGRLRLPLLSLILIKQKKNPNVAVIGCGQFAFSTLGYALIRRFGNIFLDCYDIDENAKKSFSDFYRILKPAAKSEEIFKNENVEYVYITSNHASHADYAISAMIQGKIVYLEKPIVVSKKQLSNLLECIKRTKAEIYAGYNRPFSNAIKDLHYKVSSEIDSAITFSCFVSGHRITSNHWYRDPEEGTRICGNVGHWIDLAVHILSWKECPDKWSIQVAYSSNLARDDDISISMTSSRGDLIVIILTSRAEPFEGINETINFQQGNIICKIDDFKSSTIWKGQKKYKKKFWPKDVGHNQALCQPFDKSVSRDWDEVIKSTLLMLHISEMVKKGDMLSSFSFEKSMSSIS